MKSASTLQADAWIAIVRGLGLADALRCRILFELGGGDYVRERDELFASMTLDDWVKASREAVPGPERGSGGSGGSDDS